MKVVLIVDDSQDYRSMLSEFFSDDFETIEAASGKEAASIVETKKVDFIISDLQMPDGDGLWLLDYLRRKQSSTPVIITSASITVNSKQLVEAGATAFFPKNGKLSLLKVYIDRILGL